MVTLDDGHLGQAVGRRCLAYIAVRVFEDIARCQQLPGSHSGIRRDRPECAAVERSDFAADPVHLQRGDLAAEGFQRESAVRHADGRIDVTAAGDCQAAHIAVRTDRDRAAACDAVAVQVQQNGAALSRSDRRVCGGHDAAVFDRFRSSVLQQHHGARAIPRLSRRVQRVGKADVIGGIAVRRQAGRKLCTASAAYVGRSIYILMRAGLVTVYAHTVFPVGVQTGLSAGALAVYNIVFVRQDRHIGQTRIFLTVPHYGGVIGKAKRIAVRQQIRRGDTDAVIYPDYLEFAAFQFHLGRGSFRDIQLCYRHITALYVKLSAERHLGHRPAACQRQCAVRVDRCGFIPAVPVQIERDRFVDDKAPVYVRQQLDGIAVLRIVQRTREGGIRFAVHLRYAGKSRDVDSGLRLYGCVFRLMNVQRVTARGCFRRGPDNDLICAVPIVFLGHGKVRVKSVFLDIGFQRIGAGVGHSKFGVSSRLDVCRFRGDRQRRFGNRFRSAARLYAAELFGSFAADRVCTVSKHGFLRRAAADRGRAVERLAGRPCFGGQRDSLRRSGDGHAAAVKVQRAAYADLRAADGAGAGNNIQTAVDCRCGTGGSLNGEHAAIDLYIAGDRAVRQRQAIRCIDAAGYAEACHINRRRGVDSNIILRDVAEQSDLGRFHLVQDLLQRGILCIADLRHTFTLGLHLDAVFFTGIHGRDAAGLAIPGGLDRHDDRILLLAAVLLVLNGRRGSGSCFRRRRRFRCQRRLLRRRRCRSRRRCRRGLVLFDFRRSRGCGRGRRRHRSVFRRCRNRQQREAQRQRQKKAQYTSFHGMTSDMLKSVYGYKCWNAALSGSVLRYETELLRGGFGFAAAAYAELIENVTDVGLHGRQLNIHNLADLGVAFIGAQQREHLPFGGGQLLAGGKARLQKPRVVRGLYAHVREQLFVPACAACFAERLEQREHRRAVHADRADEAERFRLGERRGKGVLPRAVLFPVERDGAQHAEMDAVDIPCARLAVALERRKRQKRGIRLPGGKLRHGLREILVALHHIEMQCVARRLFPIPGVHIVKIAGTQRDTAQKRIDVRQEARFSLRDEPRADLFQGTARVLRLAGSHQAAAEKPRHGKFDIRRAVALDLAHALHEREHSRGNILALLKPALGNGGVGQPHTVTPEHGFHRKAQRAV